MPIQGRHQSTCKAGKKTIQSIEAIPGVTGVVIGMSFGGKSLGRNATTGHFKIQRTVPGGIKGLLQSSKGVQEIFIRTEADQEEKIRHILISRFHS